MFRITLLMQRGRRMYHNVGSMSAHSDYLPLMVMGDNSSDLTINETSVGLQHQLLQPPCFDPINGFSGSAAAADMLYAELPPVMDSSNAVFYHHHPVHYDALVNQVPYVFEAGHGEQKLLENRTRHHAWGLKQGGQKNEKQRRERLGKKFEDLKSLIPNSTKPYRASIVADTIEYINELLRTVEELKMLAEKKRQRGKKMAAAAVAATAAGDVESCSSLAVAAPMAEGGPSSGMLRSSWIQRKSKETFVDVRIVDDEVNIKVTRRRRANCLLAVAKALDELRLELLHLSAGNVGGSNIFMLNAKIHDGSSVYASAIAKKLIEAIDVV
ncbi:transcription factor TIP2-like [Zingiber officinale]|nr:transcription factor TIP2-like [Zingiber officinale]